MKTRFKNRNDKNIVVVIDRPENVIKGLAFVMHGLGGVKDQPNIRILCEELVRGGYIAVSFDAVNTFGESEGDYGQATVTNYYDDLQDVLNWAEGQEWYIEPIVLVGSSLGGMCSLLYAEKLPNKVKAMALMAPLVSGRLSYDLMQKNDPEGLKSWQESGWLEKPRQSLPGAVKRLPWSHMEDRLKYDVLPDAGKITMPVLIIVGSADTSCPVEDQKLLFGKFSGDKEMRIIDGMPHTPLEEGHLKEYRAVFRGWAERVL